MGIIERKPHLMARWWSVVLIAGCATAAQATSGPGLVWVFQDTGFNAFQHSGVGMRGDGVWPVIFTDIGDVYGLFATEGPNFTNWHELGINEYGPAGRLRVSTSSDGRLAVVTGHPSTPGVVMSPLGAFTPLASGTRAAVFDSTGNLFTADDLTISGISTPSFSGLILDMSISNNGDIGVYTSVNMFYELSPLLGTWQSYNLNSVFPVNPSEVALQYDSDSVPHLIGRSSGDLYAADFSTVSGTWTGATVTGSLSGDTDSQWFDLAANDVGVVGTAVIQDGDLYYCYFDPVTDTWLTSLVASVFGGSEQLGIAYDHEGLPVISYRDGSNYWLAYDPIIAPEPTSAALMMCGVAAVGWRRRS